MFRKEIFFVFHSASDCFTQCPNAEFAISPGLRYILPLLCNCNFFGISQIHGQIPIARKYETVTDEGGFLVSRKKIKR